jgi:hypothetical protein
VIRRVSSFKKVLASMIVLGSMSFLTVAGTFAIMNSDINNNRASFASGTLTFSNTVGLSPPATACYSVNGPLNANPSCDALVSPTTLMYPGTLVPAKVTIANDGSLDPSDLSVYMGSCTPAPQGSPNAPVYTNPGTGANPCGLAGLQFYVQETDQSWAATKCWFPAGTTACNLVNNSMFIFANTYKSAGNLLDLGIGPAHGQSRYFIVGMELPPTASNSLQGQEALFSMTWGFAQ